MSDPSVVVVASFLLGWSVETRHPFFSPPRIDTGEPCPRGESPSACSLPGFTRLHVSSCAESVPVRGCVLIHEVLRGWGLPAPMKKPSREEGGQFAFVVHKHK